MDAMNAADSVAMAVTNLGESMVLISTALAAAAWLWLSRQRHLALCWLLAVGGCAATMMALKLGFLTCGALVLDGAIRTPSGHTAMASIFYGAAAITGGHLAAPLRRRRRALIGAALALALAVGLSRLEISAHNPPEVAVGLLVGLGWLCGFAVLTRRDGAVPPPPPAILAAIALLYGGLLAVGMTGEHVSAEGVLGQIAHLLNARGVCAPPV
jgi:hypothetical protein